jgi:hypothetical protein
MTTPHERALKIGFRVIGTGALLALPFVFVPDAWMDAIHRRLGMGALPAEPVVGYLARSASLFYAMLGGLLWVVSFDLRRHRPVLLYLATVFLAFGCVLLAVDGLQGLPLWWTLGEGSFNIAIGIAGLLLARRIPQA